MDGKGIKKSGAGKPRIFFYGDSEGVREGMRFDNSLRIARIMP